MKILAQLLDPGAGGNSSNLPVSDVPKLSELETVFRNVVGVVTGFAGIVLFIMLVVGGFQWLTAQGDPKGIEGAQKTLTYAIGGIILIALGFLILKLIETFTGAPVSVFKIVQ